MRNKSMKMTKNLKSRSKHNTLIYKCKLYSALLFRDVTTHDKKSLQLQKSAELEIDALKILSITRKGNNRIISMHFFGNEFNNCFNREFEIRYDFHDKRCMFDKRYPSPCYINFQFFNDY